MKKAFRFFVSGCCAALIEYVSFMFLMKISEMLFLSQSTSFLLGFIVSFLLNKNWVFNTSNKFSGELSKYALLAGINLILTNIIIEILAQQPNVDLWLAKFLTMTMVATWNYVIFSKLIFKKNIQ